SLNYVGIDAAVAQGALLRHLGLGATTIIGKDGRKPVGWQDRLELDIFGDWDWEEGNIAGNAAERSQGKGSGRHGAQWVRRDTTVPTTVVLKHVPGYTIVDNVFVFNGSVYMVTDSEADLPPLESMTLGTFGGHIRGTSWMVNNAAACDTLDSSIDSEGRTTLSPPQRLIYPHNRFFSDPNPPFDKHWIRRHRYESGLHPYLIKAAFPSITLQYYEDWDDYYKMGVPFVFERLLIADRKSASASLQPGQPINSPFWWEPVRRTLALYFDRLTEEAQDAHPTEQGIFHWRGGPKKVITYIDNQNEAGVGKDILVPTDYELLMRALRKLARDQGYEFHIVSTSTLETSWEKRMDTIVRSTVILGPSSHATLMEFFPENEFVLTREIAVRNVGINYVAWCGKEQYSGSSLPRPSTESNHPVNVNTDAVVAAVHAILSRRDS
ncbi:hypothetical protein BKA70DRAFT_1245623, partial [Coprinopsis sp. MPI-PUGE-AT-0042]